MNALYFYKSFLRKVTSYTGELARLTRPADLHMNGPIEKLVVNISRSNPHFILMIEDFNAKVIIVYLMTKLLLNVPSYTY